MNTLSILLYLSEVVYSLAQVSIIGLILFWLGYFFYTLGQKVWADGIYSSDDPEVVKKKKEIQLKSVMPPKKYFMWTAVVVFFLVLVPNKETFYMIVASEAGETIVKTPEAQELMKDVREVLDAQIEKLKK